MLALPPPASVTIEAFGRVRGSNRTAERYEGHKALWFRVIVRAAFDLASYKNDTRLKEKKYASDAYKWLFDDSFLFNSFENVCVLLNISPEKTRRWAAGLSKDDVQKIEHAERRPSVEVPKALIVELKDRDA